MHEPACFVPKLWDSGAAGDCKSCRYRELAVFGGFGFSGILETDSVLIVLDRITFSVPEYAVCVKKRHLLDKETSF
jgi:hypothetical protein